jgi:hypothetical protein
VKPAILVKKAGELEFEIPKIQELDEKEANDNKKAIEDMIL